MIAHLSRVLVLLVCAALSAKAQEPTRLALVIGNQAYADRVGPLKNPHHDVEIVGKALETDGFKVTTLHDVGRRRLLSAVTYFAAELAKFGSNAVGFLYYSGRGVSRPDDRANYLIPVDLQDTGSPDFWFDAVKLDEVLSELERAAPSAADFIVFDACRNELKRIDKARPRPPPTVSERARSCLRGDRAAGTLGQQRAVAARLLWRRPPNAATLARDAKRGRSTR